MSSFTLKIKIGLVISSFFLINSLQTNGQTVKTSDQIEDIITKTTTQIGHQLRIQKGISRKEMQMFLQHYSDIVVWDKGSLYKNIQDDSITTANSNTYINIMVAKYAALYEDYKQLPPSEKSKTHSVDAAVDPPWPGACNTGCDNTDFENGTLSGWMACYSNNTSTASTSSTNGSFSYAAPTCTGILAGGTTAAVYPTTGLPQVNITSVASGNDPVCGAFIPQLCPSGGKYSVEIGDYDNPSYGVGILEQSFNVTAANCDFTYWYAVVIENPSGHSHFEQPYFNVYMYDQNGNVIPFCGNYSVTADSAHAQGNFKGFYYAPDADTCYCRPWTTVFMPLKKYIGQCVTIKVVTSDCALGGHFGYAYFDAQCSKLGIISSAPAICGKPITLTAPAGGAAYKWTGPCIIGPSNTQTITIGCGGKYTVIVQSYIGATCADTLDTVVVSSVGAPPVPNFKSDTVCVGNATQFNNLTTGTGNTYSWNFGDPASGANDTTSVANPVHTYPAAGTYTVTLNAVNNGCGGDTSFTAIVNSVATPGFKAPPVCLNNPTVFTDTSVGASSWKWNFGEPSSGVNNKSNLQNPTHTYATAGTFTVTLTVGTAPCIDSTKQVITVNPLPTPLFTFNTVCFGQATTFTDASTITGGTITTWSWIFGDPTSGINNVSSLQNPTHIFTAPGTYSVMLTVTSNFGCQNTLTLSVVVGAVPVAAFTATTVCQGHANQFTDNSTVSSGTITSWIWKFGDGGTSALQDPSYTYTVPGVYTATLTVVSSGGCSDSTSKTITVNPTPVPKFTVSNGCLGYTSSFTDGSTIGAGGSIASWAWTFGDGGTSALQNPTHVYLTAGTFTITLKTTSNGGCDSTYTGTVVVSPIPKPAFTANSPCQGNATLFTDGSTISSGTMANWNWTFGDGNTSNIQSPSNTYATAGTYTVHLVITSNMGCIDSVKQPVTVNPNPVVNFKADDTAGCVPLCVNFSDLSTISSGNITSWNWNFGDGSSSQQSNPSHCYTKVGTFSVTLTVTSGDGCTTTFTRIDYINTYPIPDADFLATPNPTPISQPTIDFIDESNGSPVSWYWTFGDDDDSIALTKNTVHTYADTGTYWVTLKIVNKYGCTDSIMKPVTIEPQWTFYVPNAFTPNGDGINDGFIGKGTDLRSYEMWIFDRWGMQLYHCTDITKPWDGTVQGSSIQCQEDTYVYLIIIKDVFRNQHRYVGRVTLIR